MYRSCSTETPTSLVDYVDTCNLLLHPIKARHGQNRVHTFQSPRITQLLTNLQCQRLPWSAALGGCSPCWDLPLPGSQFRGESFLPLRLRSSARGQHQQTTTMDISCITNRRRLPMPKKVEIQILWCMIIVSCHLRHFKLLRRRMYTLNECRDLHTFTDSALGIET